MDFLLKLFSGSDFEPHIMCLSGDRTVLWLQAISDSLIALAYYLIPFLLFYFTRRRRDVRFHWIFVAFGAFILACGTTHLLDVVTLWNPIYRALAVAKVLTALSSVSAFLVLGKIMPQVLRIPGPGRLEAEIEERRAAETEILRMNAELEERVATRTAELVLSESNSRRLAEEQKQAAVSLASALDHVQREMARRRELETQLVHAQKMEAIGRLAGGIAHDFNNLLTVILGYNEMLRDHVKNDPVASEFTAEIIQAAERASAFTNQLLAFSRRQIAVPRVIDLNQQVRQIDRLLRRIIGEDVELETRLQPDLPPIKVDPSHIDQVIMNLAVNSRDAMPNGGTLTIETASVELGEDYAAQHLGVVPGRYVMLAVSDSGFGMDENTRSHIFEPFFTTKEKGKGTGLGLSIVYGIVKQSGGEILVYSEPDKGTVFKIYFPLAAPGTEETQAPGAEEARLAATETILLVEDETQVRNLTRSILSRQGYRILTAASPAEALAIVEAATGNIHMMLTDIVMPQMNGLELAEKIRVIRPSLKVLFMSGYTDNAVVNQGILSHDMPFIQKPFTAAALHKKVREVLGS